MDTTTLKILKGWVQDLTVKNQALEEENKSLKSRIVSLTRELELERMPNGNNSVNNDKTQEDGKNETMSKSSERQPRIMLRRIAESDLMRSRRIHPVQIEGTPDKSRMSGSVWSMSSDGANSLSEEPVVEFSYNNVQTETPSVEEEIDIKEEDVGYGQFQSKQDIQIKSEVEENIVNMDCSDSDPDYNKEPDSESEHFKCGECNKSFQSWIRLKEHMRVHTSEKPFKCDVCKKSFARSDHMNEHKRIHSVEKPYKCNMCAMSFKRLSYLTGHKRIHTAGKPYKCDECEKSFTRAFNLTEHKRGHTGGKRFKCDVCQTSFASRYLLTSHRRIHSGQEAYKCDLCEKSFATLNVLTSHKGIHTGEKPYECSVCGKGFTTKGTLNTHTKIHTGEKLFKCDVCVRSFSQKIHLIAHKKKHSGERKKESFKRNHPSRFTRSSKIPQVK